MNLLENLPPLTWGLIAAAAVAGWGLAWAYRWYRQRRARKALVAAVTTVAANHLVNVLVPDGMGGAFHVDFVLLTPRGAVVIDLRDVRGNVFGGDQMDAWTVMDGARRFTFANPQSGLYDRIAAVKALAADMPVEGRIVFTPAARFPKGLPKWTLMMESLRAEFPLAEPAVVASTREHFAASWTALERAVAPSLLGAARPVAVP
ncbi:MAG: nuclease-related domain-containing protein [Steroidobacteraceae bacterium]